MNSSQPLRFAIVGCGAISELYYTPALIEVSKQIPLEIIALYDPSQQRVASLQKSFPSAIPVSDFESLVAISPGYAIVASPPKFHSFQVNELLAAGVHVLCEKPMASSVVEAESMIIAARKANCILAIGLFRRFFPALQAIDSLLKEGSLGIINSFHIEEGGLFNWPAASASFFQRKSSQGGVLLDLGVHVLDLVCWWFGEPTSIRYEDDMLGNLEANCRLSLSYDSGLRGDIRMSRDTPCSNKYHFEFERGCVSWSVGDGNKIQLRMNGIPYDFDSQLYTSGRVASTYSQSFVNQLLNFISATQGHDSVVVPGEEGIRSLRLIEYCYANRNLMAMPWLTDLERQQALKLSEVYS